MITEFFPRTPQLDGDNVEALRQQIRVYFNATFSRYEQLFEILTCDEAYFHKPIPLRHPLIFYFGHTATFFINKLLIAGLISQRIHPEYEAMFAVGVDEMSWDDLDENHYTWPTVAEVKAYRSAVRKAVDTLIAQTPLSLPIHWAHPWWTILMAIEHERIHLETSSVLIRQQRIEWVRPHPAWPACPLTDQTPEHALVNMTAGQVKMGKPRNDPLYGWDNEYGEQIVDVAGFQAGKYLVSNAQFLAFVEAGGYENTTFWDEEGWAWRCFTQVRHPEFWLKLNHSWQLRLMTSLIDMPWDWPAEVNYHEAHAWCQWHAAMTGQPVRLPTEAEWYRLYDTVHRKELLPDARTDANLHLDYWASACPVTQFAQGECFDVVGNVWQWCATPIYPFPGFEVHPHYDDFTVPTFDGHHMLIKGGSWISTGNETRRSARYAFRKHFFQHAGFRYVVGEAPPPPPDLYYESDQQLAEYAEFHYGACYYNVANFPKTLAELAISAMQGKAMHTALDLGCAVGRATFELARTFDHVTGVDFSARFIQMGAMLAQSGQIRYSLVEEGDLRTYTTRELAVMGLDAVRHKVHFLQGDACNLKTTLRNFDLVLAANLIDRLYRPELFLREVHSRINAGGVLMITSPYTWLTSHTPREEWLGGFKRNGENVTGLDGLKAILSTHFRLMAPPVDIPFVIRETRRKFQHSLSEVSLWERLS